MRSALALALLVACSSSSSAHPAADAAADICAATVQAEIGAPCHSNLECRIGYPCGAFSQQADCVCNGKQFQCWDATDPTHANAPLMQGADPTCVAYDGGTQRDCPASVDAARAAKSCPTAGQVCVYANTCTGDASATGPDTCQCVGDGSGGLQWSCETVCP